MIKLRSVYLTILAVVLPLISFAQDTAENTDPTVSERINSIFEPIVGVMAKVVFWQPFSFLGEDNPLSGLPVVVIWLVLGALFFTLYNKFINLRGFKHAIQLVRGVYDNPDDKGEVSHFQALVTALSGTVGLGNIAGVAVAVTVGGAGATFWMILAGLLGMSAKFVECTLGVKYRKISETGEVSGGPMYYLSEGLEKKGFKGLGIVLAIFFAILCIGGSFGGGNMFQANQAFAQLSGEFSGLEGNGAYFGIVLALLVGVVIIGGIKSIAKVTDKIVPVMVGLYVIFSLIIIGMNIGNIGEAFGAIFNGAFNNDAAVGGIIGVLIVGFQRAAFSNEAGVGSASIAHSAAKTKEHVSEGIVALLEPFVDTVVICTMTALVLIFTGFSNPSKDVFMEKVSEQYNIEQSIIDKEATSIDEFVAAGHDVALGDELVLVMANKGAEFYEVIGDDASAAESYKLTDKLEGAKLTSASFTSVFPWFKYVLMIAIVLFAFSTMISWSYYGLKAWTYLFGKSKASEYAYKGIFLIFIVIGSSSSLGAVIDFSDMMILGMAFPNILGLYFFAKEVKHDLTDYFARIKSGEIKKYK